MISSPVWFRLFYRPVLGSRFKNITIKFTSVLSNFYLGVLGLFLHWVCALGVIYEICFEPFFPGVVTSFLLHFPK
jgi:hypothetical protein